MVGGDLVPGRMILRAFTDVERSQDFQCLAIQDVYDRCSAHVKKSLVRGERRATRLQVILAVAWRGVLPGREISLRGRNTGHIHPESQDTGSPGNVRRR